jgi:hypothetical protein
MSQYLAPAYQAKDAEDVWLDLEGEVEVLFWFLASSHLVCQWHGKGYLDYGVCCEEWTGLEGISMVY